MFRNTFTECDVEFIIFARVERRLNNYPTLLCSFFDAVSFPALNPEDSQLSPLKTGSTEQGSYLPHLKKTTPPLRAPGRSLQLSNLSIQNEKVPLNKTLEWYSMSSVTVYPRKCRKNSWEIQPSWFSKSKLGKPRKQNP